MNTSLAQHASLPRQLPGPSISPELLKQLEKPTQHPSPMSAELSRHAVTPIQDSDKMSAAFLEQASMPWQESFRMSPSLN
mmetsp:Transcript_912/g.1583  ORF Transcript_912/g.1583 Transcript_912/m.1583 type:complete len:80 (-) Transcript_912:122-361(-)